ncbi:MAG: hypothetical protein MKZ70_00750, partial [Opitutales bacterium]|nr:hypothetical protein [Opitutales bacterium]
IEGVDENSQLSFSNPMNINRGVASFEQARSILSEYRNRLATTEAFAEWFSIYPPFPYGIFGDEKIVGGAYCNGGIMPLVGGELARAYLQSGFEPEGLETLRKYHQLISRKDETFLWYFPDGTESTVDASTSPDATPTDGWGSSSMLYGLIEGLAGIQDHARHFQSVKLAPRWAAAEVADAEVSVAYQSSEKQLQYQYRASEESLSLNIESEAIHVNGEILIPPGRSVKRVSQDGNNIGFVETQIGDSRYACFVANFQGGSEFEIQLD